MEKILVIFFSIRCKGKLELNKVQRKETTLASKEMKNEHFDVNATNGKFMEGIRLSDRLQVEN